MNTFALIAGAALAAAVAMAMLTTFAVIAAAIRRDERRESLASTPSTRGSALTRLLLSAYAAPAPRGTPIRPTQGGCPMPVIRTDLPRDRHCPCGALLDHGKDRCRKCRARSRWQRRKAPRTRPDTRRRHRAPGTRRRAVSRRSW